MAHPAAHLPKTAPKKTGKAGIKPLDPEEDFDVPTFQDDDGPEIPDSELDAFVAAVKAPRSERKKEPEKLKEPSGKRQADLPGFEDKHLKDLEEAAYSYAKIRDKRVSLLRQEVDMKELLLTLMKRHDKKLYRVEELEIKVVPTEETVKVKILEDDD
jgi:hypothetical protein